MCSGGDYAVPFSTKRASLAKSLSEYFTYIIYWSGPQTQPARKGLGKNLARKCLEHWNATVNADEGTNITSANQHSS